MVLWADYAAVSTDDLFKKNKTISPRRGWGRHDVAKRGEPMRVCERQHNKQQRRPNVTTGTPRKITRCRRRVVVVVAAMVRVIVAVVVIVAFGTVVREQLRPCWGEGASMPSIPSTLHHRPQYTKNAPRTAKDLTSGLRKKPKKPKSKSLAERTVAQSRSPH